MPLESSWRTLWRPAVLVSSVLAACSPATTSNNNCPNGVCPSTGGAFQGTGSMPGTGGAFQGTGSVPGTGGAFQATGSVPGTGGALGTGAVQGTGSVPGTGGVQGTGSVQGTGAVQGTGSTAATGGVGGGEPLGGYHKKGNWAGFAFTFEASGATITPADFGDMIDNDGPYCVSGSVLGTPPTCSDCNDGYTSIAALGFNTSQPKISDAPFEAIEATGDGLFVDLKVNSGETGIRIQLEDGTDPSDPNAADHRWCVNLDGTQATTIPWETFNTTCWDGKGTDFDPATSKIAKVLAYVPDPGETAASLPFDFCINDIGPDNVMSRGHGDIVASCNNTSVNWNQSLNDKFANVDGGNYRFQMNGWNLVNGGMAAQLLPGAGFKLTNQSCSTDSSSPCSFPSVYVGMNADGNKSGGFSPRPISQITSIPTCLGWASNGTSGQDYNVSYDVWFNSNAGAQGAEKFLMIWFHDPPNFQPGGMFPQQDGVVIGDQVWSVWSGPNADPNNSTVTSYVAPKPRADGQAYSFDLKDFIDDALTRMDERGGAALSSNLHLIAVMGGMEVWKGAQGAQITGFRAEVK